MAFLRKIKLLMLSLFLMSASCRKEEAKINGCTDYNALNYDYSANVDNGSCEYSKFVFYAKYSSFLYNGFSYPITNVEISINGNYIGSTEGTYYPTQPNNCYANGTATYEVANTTSVGWNAVIYLSNGAQLYTSGVTSPSKYNNCIKINVTK
jgi:hypothetical protein